MSELNIGIVEDELLIARSIIQTLNELGYRSSEAAISYTEAMDMLEQEQPDLVLLDINLSGKKDGIDVAEQINQHYKIPFIFLTANSDTATIERAKKVKPHAYLVKPFTKEELFASIEIACSNFNQLKLKEPQPNTGFKMAQAIFVRENHSFHKILLSEIVFVESEENYVKVNMINGKRIMVRSTFSDFLEQLPGDLFFRTGRSHAVQLDLIDKIDPTEIHIKGHRIPLSKTNKDELYERLGIRVN